MSTHILLVDDDTLLRRSVGFYLEQAGYRVSTAGKAEDALALAQRDLPDLVLLDIALPGMDGLEALRRFNGHLQVPVIFLTGRRRQMQQVLGLELGAEDYITKPFDKDVLLAHIRAVLRRVQRVPSPVQGPTPLVIGDLTIDPGGHTVTVGGESVQLPPREFELLHALALQAGQVVSIDELLSRVWGAEFEGESEVVYVHIRWLREKLEDDPRHPRRIVTIHGVGYKLEPQEV